MLAPLDGMWRCRFLARGSRQEKRVRKVGLGSVIAMSRLHWFRKGFYSLSARFRECEYQSCENCLFKSSQ